jgi:hypothetical protein
VFDEAAADFVGSHRRNPLTIFQTWPTKAANAKSNIAVISDSEIDISTNIGVQSVTVLVPLRRP